MKTKIIIGLIVLCGILPLGRAFTPASHHGGPSSSDAFFLGAPMLIIGLLMFWLFASLVIRFYKSVFRRFGAAGVVAVSAGTLLGAANVANRVGGGGGGGYTPTSMHGRED